MSTLAIWGPPGTGKTTVVVRTAPRPLLVVDVDNKIGKMENLEVDLEDPNVIIVPIRKGLVEESLKARLKKMASVKDLTSDATIVQEPLGFAEIVDHVNAVSGCREKGLWPTWVNREGKEVEIATFFVDSGTRMLEHMKRFMLFYAHKGAITIPGWGVWLAQLEELMIVSCAMQPNFIISFHEKKDQNALTGVIETLPSIEGQMASKIGSYFEEMYHTELEVNGEKKEYRFRTADTKLQCRTSHNMKVLTSANLSKVLPGLEELKATWQRDLVAHPVETEEEEPDVE